MTVPSYTEEDVELVRAAVVKALAKPGELSLGRTVLDALAAAGRLVPPGSETREEWIAVIDDDLALDARDEARAHRIVELEGGHVESRKVITTPWSPSVPDTKERDDA